MVAEDRSGGPGCQARVRLVTEQGQVFAMFIDLDASLRPTALRSLAQTLAQRAAEMDLAIEELRDALPRVLSPGVDDARLLVPMQRLRRALKNSEQDVDNGIATLEGLQLQKPEQRFRSRSNRKAP